MDKHDMDIKNFVYVEQISVQRALITKYCRQDCAALMYLVFKFYLTMKDLLDRVYDKIIAEATERGE